MFSPVTHPEYSFEILRCIFCHHCSDCVGMKFASRFGGSNYFQFLVVVSDMHKSTMALTDFWDKLAGSGVLR